MKTILQRFLDLFNKKVNAANTPPINLNLNEVHTWLENIHLDLINKASLESISSSHFNKLKDFRWVVEDKVDRWLVTLQNCDGLFGKDDIHLLLVQSRSLVREIDISNELDIWQIISLNQKFRKNLPIVLERISKSSFAQNYHFLLDREDGKDENSNSSGGLNGGNPLQLLLTEVQQMVEEFHRILIQSGVQKLESIALSSERLQNHSSRIDQLQKVLEEKIERLKLTQNKLSEKEASLEDLKKDPQYGEIEYEQRERKKQEEHRRKNSQEILDFFSTIKPVLEKYRGLTEDKELIGSYINDPLQAFIDDDNLSILHVLDHLKAILSSGKMEMPLQHLSVIIPLIENACNGVLEKLHRERFSLKKKPRSPLLDKDLVLRIEEAEYRLQHFRSQTETVSEQIATIEEAIGEESLRRNQERELFQDMVRIGLNRNVSIFF
ncbi:MAG: hypothetical protein Q8Q01_01945 [archaeon]|nr:hypothetical protein [archaeon]